MAFSIGPDAGSLNPVRIDLDGNVSQLQCARRIQYNRSGQTIVQYGPPWREWSGTLYADSAEEMGTLRLLFDQRRIWVQDSSSFGGDPVEVLWQGDWSPILDDPLVEYAQVPFHFIQTEVEP